MINRASYSSDLTDKQWALIEAHIPAAKAGGCPRKTDPREIVNAIFYILRSGCSWRSLPHDFPKWQLVYGYFRQWEKQGLWLALNDRLREQVRQAAGREAQPSAAIIDSQSVKTTQKGASRL
jgi:putative transposase